MLAREVLAAMEDDNDCRALLEEFLPALTEECPDTTEWRAAFT
jgi:hypothetical protein